MMMKILKATMRKMNQVPNRAKMMMKNTAVTIKREMKNQEEDLFHQVRAMMMMIMIKIKAINHLID